MHKMPLFNDIIKLPNKISILDLGAINVEGHNLPYQNLVDQNLCNVIGFEPCEKECHKLNKLYSNKGFKYYPYCIFDGKPHDFHTCKMKTCSSLYYPNLKLCNNFQCFGEWMEIENTKRMETSTLNDLQYLLDDVDYIKADIQGAELVAFENGKNIIDSSIIAEVEVEFVEQYVNQPLFSEIELFFRKSNYFFHFFSGYGTRCIKPIVRGNNITRGFNQWLWSNAIFIKNIFNGDINITESKFLKLSAVLHEVYNSYDFAFLSLKKCDDKYKTDYSEYYLSKIDEYIR